MIYVLHTSSRGIWLTRSCILYPKVPRAHLAYLVTTDPAFIIHESVTREAALGENQLGACLGMFFLSFVEQPPLYIAYRGMRNTPMYIEPA